MDTVSLKDLSPEDFRKWQLKLLEILVYFRDFCKEHNLRFTLSAGTCLGAVRHHGFIPWDDDLDVQMPRDDYEKLYELWDKYADKNRFKLLRTTKDVCVNFPMTVIKSENTTCIYSHSVNSDISQGIKIDVEYLDGVPENPLVRKLNMFCCRVFALFRAQRVPIQTSKWMKLGARILLLVFPTQRMRWRISELCEKQVRKYKFDDSELVRYAGMKPWHRHCMDKIIEVEFEGEKMPIPAGYDEFLKTWYGDYMKLPPVESRYPKSGNIVFYDLNTSYKEYKGIHYCKK